MKRTADKLISQLIEGVAGAEDRLREALREPSLPPALRRRLAAAAALAGRLREALRAIPVPSPGYWQLAAMRREQTRRQATGGVPGHMRISPPVKSGQRDVLAAMKGADQAARPVQARRRGKKPRDVTPRCRRSSVSDRHKSPMVGRPRSPAASDDSHEGGSAMAKKPAKKAPKPKGLHVFGTDGKVYRVKDAAALEPADANGVHGVGLSQKKTGAKVPAAVAEGDVSGHDMQLGVWHRWWAWGWLYNEAGVLVYVYHYHPYGTFLAIYA